MRISQENISIEPVKCDENSFNANAQVAIWYVHIRLHMLRVLYACE